MVNMFSGKQLPLAALLCLSAGTSQAQHGPRFNPGEAGNGYHLCYAVEADGRAIRIPGADASCRTLEFAREDCEKLATSAREAVFNRGSCLQFRKEHIRVMPMPPTGGK